MLPFDRLLKPDFPNQRCTESGNVSLVAGSVTGARIIADNVIRNGDFIEPKSRDPGVQDGRRFHERVPPNVASAPPRFEMVRSKSYDGFTTALVMG